MDPVSAGLAIAGIGSSLIGGRSAAKKAASAAKAQSRLTYVQRQEEIRRKERQFDMDRGAGIALAGASNVQISGSTKRYLNEMDMEYARQTAHAKLAAHMERRAIRKGASGAGDGLYAQAAGDAIGFAAQLYANRTASTATTTGTASSQTGGTRYTIAEG